MDTYIALARAEPDALPLLMDLPRALAAVPPTAVPFADLARFEAHYGDPAMRIVHYLWYHGRLFLLAERLYAALADEALRRLWQVFVVPARDDASATQLAELLAAVHPLLAHTVAQWPHSYDEG